MFSIPQGIKHDARDLSRLPDRVVAGCSSDERSSKQSQCHSRQMSKVQNEKKAGELVTLPEFGV